MSDLTFNKIAAAGIATAFVIVGLGQVTGAVFHEEAPKVAGYKIDVVIGEEEGPVVADTLPDWGTVLPTADIAAGEAVFAKCTSCHTIVPGGANGTGPNLNGVVGRKPGGHAGFAYSANMTAFAGKAPVWDYDHLYEFLKNPKGYITDTKMTFVGLKKPEDRIAVIAYLKSQGGTLPVPPVDPSRAPGAAAAAAPAEGAAPPAAGAAPATKEGQPTTTATEPPKSAAGGPAGQGSAPAASAGPAPAAAAPAKK